MSQLPVDGLAVPALSTFKKEKPSAVRLGPTPIAAEPLPSVNVAVRFGLPDTLQGEPHAMFKPNPKLFVALNVHDPANAWFIPSKIFPCAVMFALASQCCAKLSEL